MGKSKYFIFMTVMLGMATAQSKNDCFTPHNENGVCIEVRFCKKIYSLIETEKHNSTVLAYIKNSFCGYSANNPNPKVCCPKNTVDPSFLSSKLPSRDECGKVKVSAGKIVGGNVVELGFWPWMVALGYQSYYKNTGVTHWLCGGTLISDRYVLTAAHCTADTTYRKLVTARLGDLDLNPDIPDDATPLDVPVERIITHAEYNSQSFTNDISLVKLNTTVTFTNFIQPICLPILPDMSSTKLLNTKPFVAGWGRTTATAFESKTLNTELMEVRVNVMNNVECKQAYTREKSMIDDRVICAGYQPGGKDSCNGDSGGPLMYSKEKEDKYNLIGIVSYGYRKCGEPGYPGVYTRVTSFIDWIVDKEICPQVLHKTSRTLHTCVIKQYCLFNTFIYI
ncbi:Proteinase, regulatory CLIP domain,Peptidase S1A, chymotrypsin family,Serine proteases, trypsin family [Cinara cedri]|uniref:CLIP domain-containing serine protease n=1 Tax=Cinara cedri TaxID=506608 RepID=A0A5E4N7E1_9HEMI|nr:Proteinase, regulatory CLIP domain,Peptidase S1A, chymotrypsin family,Serine proteases, trypsin family [Cinara cedri]